MQRNSETAASTMKAPLLHHKAFTQSHILVKSQSSLSPVHGGTWEGTGHDRIQHRLRKAASQHPLQSHSLPARDPLPGTRRPQEQGHTN